MAPVATAVMSTPSVARVMPGPRTGLMSDTLVSRPPENRMALNATVPIICATLMLSKWMPRPSLPKSMPTARNKSKAGTPKRLPALPASMLAKKSIESVSSMNSICITLLLPQLLCQRGL